MLGLSKSDQSIFLFLQSFSGENCIWSSCLLFITLWFSLNISGETTSWINMDCSMVYWDCFVYWWYSYSSFIMIIDQQNVGKSYILWRNIFLKNSLYVLSHRASLEHGEDFFFWTLFLFFFLILFYFSARILTPESCAILWLICFKSYWLILVLFRMLWKLFTANKRIFGIIFTKTFLSVTHEMSPILVTPFLGYEW